MRDCPLGSRVVDIPAYEVYQYRSPINGFSLTLSESGQIVIIARCDDGSEISVPTESVVYGTFIKKPMEEFTSEEDDSDDEKSPLMECYKVASDDNKDINDFLLTTIAAALTDDCHILRDNIVDNILHYLQNRIRGEIETHMVHNELKAIVDVCSLAMNVSWVIGKGGWAHVPDVTTYKWPKDAFQLKLEQAWAEPTPEHRRDMLQAALRIDWSGKPQSTALSDLRGGWALFDDMSTDSVLRLAIWRESVFFDGEEDKPEEIRRVPDWREVIQSVRDWVAERVADVWEPGEVNVEDVGMSAADEVHKLIEERMPSLGLGPDDFARRMLPSSLIGRDTYSFDEMVLVYETLDDRDNRRARENCLYEVWKASFGTEALRKAVYDCFGKYAESIHSFLLPTGQSGYFVCIAAMPKVELRWKGLIHRVLRQHFCGDEKAWNDGVPEPIRIAAATLAERKKGQRSKWDCLYFVDLKTILDKNWKLVEPKIASRKRFTKNYLMDSFDRLNVIRNDLYHPMEGQTFEYADEIDDYLKDIEQFTKEVLGEQGESERETENA
jgi:hypothetical protein